MGVVVLGLALVYHFFPRVFHVEPSSTSTQRAMNLGPMTSAAPATSLRLPEPSEVDAGPPLTLAPTDVVVARLSKKNTNLPEQLSADTPEVEALIARADKALKAGQLAGDQSSAAALYEQALKLKPDSRRAAQGLFDVRERLVTEISQDLAVGDAESAGDLLGTLKLIPDSGDDVNQLQAKLKTLAQVRPLLAKAATLLQQGHVDQPTGNNALELYRQVQQLDPDNAVAAQGTLQVQRAILDRALAAVAQNDFKSADLALTEAAQIAPDSQALRDVHGRVDSMRQGQGNGLLAQARSALDAGNLTLAQQLADQAKAISPDLAGLNEFGERLTNARLYASYKPGQMFTDRFADIPGQAPSMVVVPTGSFQMGAPDNESGREDAETPQHEVTKPTCV